MSAKKLVVSGDDSLTVMYGNWSLKASIGTRGEINITASEAGAFHIAGNLASPIEGDRAKVVSDYHLVRLGNLEEFTHLMKIFTEELREWLPTVNGKFGTKYGLSVMKSLLPWL